MLTAMTLGNPSHLEGISALKPSSSLLLPSKLIICPIFMLCVGLSYLHSALHPLPTAGLASSRTYYSLLISLRETDDSLVQLSYLKPRLPSHLPGIKISAACFILCSSSTSLVFALFWALLHCGGVLLGYIAELPKPLLSPEVSGCWWPYHYGFAFLEQQ